MADVEAAVCGQVAPMAIAIAPNHGTAGSRLAEIEATSAVFEPQAFAALEVPAEIGPSSTG